MRRRKVLIHLIEEIVTKETKMRIKTRDFQNHHLIGNSFKNKTLNDVFRGGYRGGYRGGNKR
jgi:hypothetical protein